MVSLPYDGLLAKEWLPFLFIDCFTVNRITTRLALWHELDNQTLWCLKQGPALKICLFCVSIKISTAVLSLCFDLFQLVQAVKHRPISVSVNPNMDVSLFQLSQA